MVTREPCCNIQRMNQQSKGHKVKPLILQINIKNVSRESVSILVTLRAKKSRAQVVESIILFNAEIVSKSYM